MGINCWQSIKKKIKIKVLSLHQTNIFDGRKLEFQTVEFGACGCLRDGFLDRCPQPWSGTEPDAELKGKGLFSGSGAGGRFYHSGTGGSEIGLSLEPEHWTKPNLKLWPASHHSRWLIPAVQLLPPSPSQGGFCWQICHAFQGKQDLAKALGLYIFFPLQEMEVLAKIFSVV